jgi:UDP-glucose 4-epimerase
MEIMMEVEHWEGTGSKILLTGWLGYIGSHVAVVLAAAGYEPIIVDSLVNSHEGVVERLTMIMGKRPLWYKLDLRDREGLEKVFGEHAIEGVVHCAGLKAVGESCDQVGIYHDSNISSSLRLFEVMEQFGVRRILFSSSATVYAGSNSMPLTEESVVWSTTNPYGTTKFVLERLLEDYAHHKGWSVVLLRYFNPIGAHESWLIGEAPRGVPNNLLPYLLQVAAWVRQHVGVFGDDYPTRDGTGVRDYIDVMDLAQGHLRAYRWMMQHSGVMPINLGVGMGWSVMEMIAEVEAVTGIPIPYTILPRRAGDLAEVYSDPSRAHALLWWYAQRSLRESITNSWRFVQHGG